MGEEDLGKYSRMKHTTSYKRRRTCICRGSVLLKEIWPDRWRPMSSKFFYIKKLYCYFLQKIDLQRNFKIIFQHLNLIIASLVLSFRKDVGDALLDACNFDFDDEAMKLMRVAKLVREVIFKTNYHFSGSLCDDQYN